MKDTYSAAGYSISIDRCRHYVNSVFPAFFSRFMATGDSFHLIAISFRMGISTVQEIVSEVGQAVWDELCEYVMPAPQNRTD